MPRKIQLGSDPNREVPRVLLPEMGRSVVFFSGCYWDAEGAGQRPVGLARELAKLGEQVVYYNSDARQQTCYSEGVYQVGPKHLEQLRKWALTAQGAVVSSFPSYAPLTIELGLAGWGIVYDCLDDWDGFYEAGDLTAARDETMRQEGDLMAVSHSVVCSAYSMLQRIESQYGRDAYVIRNGGPDARVPRIRSAKYDGVGPIRVVYVGHLLGSWIDWGVLRRLDEDKRLSIIIIGQAPPDSHKAEGFIPTSKWKRTSFKGPLPWREALQTMAECNVGIIPFKGRLCLEVDPIKRYHYYACDIPVVGTTVMQEMIGAPHTSLADGKDFVAAVVSEAKRDHRSSDEWVKSNSWGRRAQQLQTVLRPILRPESVYRPVPYSYSPIRSRHARAVTYEECKLRATWAGSSKCNAKPPCAYCNTQWDRYVIPTSLPAPADRVANGLVRFLDRYGPALVSVCWGESMYDDELVRIIGEIGLTNRVDLVTNMVFPVERLRFLKPQTNYAFATSFQPHLWGMSTKPFIEKRRQVQDLGYHVGVVQVVAWPPNWGRLEKWFDEFEAAGIDASIFPFRGECDKKLYPDAYTEEQWEFLNAKLITYETDILDGVYRGTESPDGKVCRTGRDYVYIGWNGAVHRCVFPQKRAPDVLGSIFGEVRLLDSPLPCSASACPCADLWKYIES